LYRVVQCQSNAFDGINGGMGYMKEKGASLTTYLYTGWQAMESL
jgi:hypothetical protein